MKMIFSKATQDWTVPMSTFNIGYKTVLYANYYASTTFIYKNIYCYWTGEKRMTIHVAKNKVFLKTCWFEDILLLLISTDSIIKKLVH